MHSDNIVELLMEFMIKAMRISASIQAITLDKQTFKLLDDSLRARTYPYDELNSCMGAYKIVINGSSGPFDIIEGK